jgi:hypothetical protein
LEIDREIAIDNGSVDLGVVTVTPKRSVSGKVYWRDGQPAEGLEIEVQRYNAVAADMRNGRSGTRTDDRGEFRVSGLRPGRYVVLASKEAAVSSSALPRAAVYAYFPGVSDRVSALVFDLRQRSETNLTLSLDEANGVSVTGTVEPSGLFPRMTDVYVALTRPFAPVLPFVSYRTKVGEKFVLPNLPPGRYDVMAIVNAPPGGKQMSGRVRQELVVGTAPISDLKMSLVPASIIQGTVQSTETKTGGANKPVAGLNLNLTTERFPLASDWLGHTNGDGEFQMAIGFSGEDYLLTIPRLPEGLYVASVTRESEELVGGQLTVTAGPSPIHVQVTLRDDGAIATGLVDSKGGRTPVRAVIILAPDAKDAAYWWRTSQSYADGSFKISGIAPGDYRIFALNQNDDEDYKQPEFLKKHSGEMATLHAGKNGVYSVKVSVIKTD